MQPNRDLLIALVSVLTVFVVLLLMAVLTLINHVLPALATPVGR